MSTRASTPFMIRRIAARAGVGVWRHRGGVLLGLVVMAGLTGYLAFAPAVANPLQLVNGGGIASASADCADTAMAAIADKSSSAAQQAYQCMDGSFQQRVNEQTFVQQIQAQALPNVQSLSRVGDYHAPAGGTMVYYAVDTNGQSVGYIVYLGQNGKVLRIE